MAGSTLFPVYSLLGLTLLIFSGSFADSPSAQGAKARAYVSGFKDAAIKGTVNFVVQGDSAVAITAEIHGLKSGMTYAMHVHTFGDCSEPDASGPHFDPAQAGHHGHLAAKNGKHHAGDLPNIKADKAGIGKMEFQSKALRLGQSDHSALGRSVIMHEKGDDYKSQPAGAAGARIACGHIGLIGK